MGFSAGGTKMGDGARHALTGSHLSRAGERRQQITAYGFTLTDQFPNYDDDSDDDEEDCGDGRGATRERLRALHLETATKQWLADQALPSDAMPTEDMYVQVAVR